MRKIVKKLTLGLILSLSCAFFAGCNSDDYDKAKKLMKQEKYEEAEKAFKKLGDYEDSKKMASECEYVLATKEFDSQNYDSAAEMFKSLGGYKDSKDKNKESIYCSAEKLFKRSNYEEAEEKYKEVEDYQDAKSRITACENKKILKQADDLIRQNKYDEAKKLLGQLSGVGEVADKIQECDGAIAAQKLSGQEYYFTPKGEKDDLKFYTLKFDGANAIVTSVTATGNGARDEDSTNCSVLKSGNKLIIRYSGATGNIEMNISEKGGKIIPDKKNFITQKDLQKKMKGHWACTISDLWGTSIEHVIFKNGKAQYGDINSNNYYSKYNSTYKLNKNIIDFKVKWIDNGLDSWFVGYKNGKVKIYNYTHEFHKASGSKIPF